MTSSFSAIGQCTVEKKNKGMHITTLFMIEEQGVIIIVFDTSLWNLCKHGKCLIVSPMDGLSMQIAHGSMLSVCWEKEKKNTMKMVTRHLRIMTGISELE